MGIIEQPHILILTPDPDEYDEDCPDFWTNAELICPHEPSESMPCAVWAPCGCRPVAYEDDWGDPGIDDDDVDPLTRFTGGPCPRSALGAHYYWEGEPSRPAAECWPTEHVDLNVAAWELHVGPGIYTVHPWCLDDVLRLELWPWVQGAAS